MKRHATSILLLIIATLAAWSQQTSGPVTLGSWSGKIKAGLTPLTLVLHLEHDGDSLKATLDSPDQGARGIPANIDHLSDDSVAISIKSINATYSACRRDDKLRGVFRQHGFPIPLVLTRGVPEVRRPQNPLPPFPYETEEVTFTNDTDSATLAGTITYPVGYDRTALSKVAPKGGRATKTSPKKPTIVMLITGSGQQNRNEALMGHSPFLVIADYLARHGIATLRYDDRATGASRGGNVSNATTEDFMRDAEAGLRFLRQRKDFGKIGCLGHSEGATIAFMLGARKQTDFIVSMAGPAVKGDTLLVRQTNRILQLMGQEGNMTVDAYRRQPAVQGNAWVRWFIDYDPAADIRRTRCPVFALNGESDCQVVADQNIPALRQLLKGTKKSLVREYPSLNHLFQHATTGLPNEYSQIEETIAPEVLADIAEWINSL